MPEQALLHEVLQDIRNFCKRNADAAQVKKYARFFTGGNDAYDVPKDIWEANRRHDLRRCPSYFLRSRMAAVT